MTIQRWYSLYPQFAYMLLVEGFQSHRKRGAASGAPIKARPLFQATTAAVRRKEIMEGRRTLH